MTEFATCRWSGTSKGMTDEPDITDHADVRRLIRSALEEDIGDGDVTTAALVPETRTADAVILSREAVTVCGTSVAAAVFHAVDPELAVDILVRDGSHARADVTLMTISGKAASILAAERTALNFMQRLSGVATMTARFVDCAGPHGTRILDTRKTTPGYRRLEKYAVKCGGGQNHRFGLFDQVLIKDNHRRLWRDGAAGGLDAAVEAARAHAPNLPVEIEVESEAELQEALKASPDWVLLDNMDPEQMARCVRLCKGVCKTEASGGITFDTLEAVASTGVDAVSLGCLTHSAPAVDLSLEWLHV